MSITQPVHCQSSVYQDMGQVLFQAQNSPFPQIISTSLLAPTWTAFSDYTGPDLLCSTVFIFSYFLFWVSWLNCQLSSTR